MGSEHKNTYTDLFSRLGNTPESVSDNDVDIKEWFVVELYIPSAQNTSSYSLGSARLENFVCSSDNNLRKLPPIREALRRQTKRSCLQSGYLWVEAVEDISLPDASLWDWIFNKNKGVFVALWQSGSCSTLKSTNSRPLAFATRESARLVTVKGLTAFPCMGVIRSMDLNKR